MRPQQARSQVLDFFGGQNACLGGQHLFLLHTKNHFCLGTIKLGGNAPRSCGPDPPASKSAQISPLPVRWGLCFAAEV